MRLFDLTENENTNLLVVYPGRFHPFHIGHGKVFKYLKQKYKGANVYIASSGKTDAHKSPFSFDEKKKMMMLAGVDPNAIVQARIPYVASEITDRYDPDNTVVVYAVSEKDMAEDPRFDFPPTGLKTKKNGEPAHVQKWRGMDEAKPLRDHSYIVTVPTFTFKIRGEPVNSATQIRNMISNADETELKQILQDLYGRTDIPQNVIEIFKRKLGGESLNENWEEDSLFESLLEVDIMWDIKTTLTETKKTYTVSSKLVDKYNEQAEAMMAQLLNSIKE
jgi:glycerol-3-phosphate cytidylyltransferase-like family protein